MLESAMVARAALRIARERKNEFAKLGQRSESAKAEERGIQLRQFANGNQATRETRRFSKGKTHKASSAEAILRHCLRQRGWSRQWRDGELTGKQSLSLLEDIRQYGRAWLRHEAEAFFDHYGVDDESRNWRDDHEYKDERGLGENERDTTDYVSNMVVEHDANGEGSRQVSRGIAFRATSAVSRFFDRAKQFARELIFSGYMAMKGPQAIAADEGAMLENQARIQAQFLDKFEQEVRANPPIEIADLQSETIIVGPAPMTPGQFVARAEQYGNSVWQSTVNGDRAATVRAAVMLEERRVLGRPKTEHCHDCPPLAALGWQPLGTLPALGDTECGNLCLCHFEFRDKDGKPSKVIKKPTVHQHRPDRPIDPAASKLPGGPGPGERPKKGTPPKSKSPKPESKLSDQAIQDLIDKAKLHGHTFSGKPGEEYKEYEEVD